MHPRSFFSRRMNLPRRVAMGLSFSELMIILVIILILFGPGKLPEIGKALGRGIREFKRAQKDLMDGEPGPDVSIDTNKTNKSNSENSSGGPSVAEGEPRAPLPPIR